jgi:hypothetical protein
MRGMAVSEEMIGDRGERWKRTMNWDKEEEEESL